MRLKLVKQSEFLGTMCDFYVDEEDNIYMSRTQIGYALQYKQPQHSILVMHLETQEIIRTDCAVKYPGSQFVTAGYIKIKIQTKSLCILREGFMKFAVGRIKKCG